MPTDLKELYQLYQREIHAAAYSVSTPLLPQVLILKYFNLPVSYKNFFVV